MSVDVPVNPRVLEWAVREAGGTVRSVSDVAHVEEEDLRRWIAGEALPNVTQLRRLSSAVKRPFATFLLPAPPASTLPAVSFRHPPEGEDRPLNFEERRWLREAGRFQRILKWTAQELNESGPALPHVKLASDPENVAQMFRAKLGVSVEEQQGWSSEYAAFREWRAALEEFGIVVFSVSMGGDAARGFSSWDPLVPLIAVNTHWRACARIYSLFHETAHLLTRTSSVCEEANGYRHESGSDPVERWCESFAAALLLPWDDVAAFLRTQHRWEVGDLIEDLAIAKRISSRYHVSLKAAVLRLVNKGAANWSLFRQIPAASDSKPEGGGGTGRNRTQIRFDSFGQRTARVLLAGLDREILSRDEVLNYLNIGDAELPDLRANTKPD